MVAEYQYLLAVAVGIPPVALAFAVARGERAMMAMAGALQTLMTPLIVFFQEIYWTPTRLFGLAFGLEDVLLNFLLGSMVWYCAVYMVRDRYRRPPAAAAVWPRLIVVTGANALLGYVLWVSGTSVMTTLVIVQCAVTAELLVLRPELWRLPVLSISLYTPIYFAWVWLIAQFLGFDTIWSGPTLWGPRIAGVPIDEIVFAATYAAFYPLLLAYTVGMRAKTETAPISAA